MALIRHKLLLAIFKWVLLASGLVLFGNQLSSQFYVHSSRPVLIHTELGKSPPVSPRNTQQFPIRKYKAYFSIDKRYFEPVLVALPTCIFCSSSKPEQVIWQHAPVIQSAVGRFPLVECLRGPPVC